MRAEQYFHRAAHQRNPRRSAHQHHFIDLLRRHPGVAHTIPAGAERAVHQIADQIFEQLARDLALIALAVPLESDHGGGRKRQRFFCPDDVAPQRLHHFADLRQILAPLRLQIFERDAQQPVIDIVAAEMGIAVGCEHLENPVVQLENRDIERAAAEIVDRDDAFLALVQSVGQRRGGRFVHQPQNFQPGNAPGIARGLPLRIVEVCRDRDHGLCHRRTQRGFGVLFELPQNQRGDFGRCKSLFAELYTNHRFAAFRDTEREQFQFFPHVFDAAPHQPLDRVDGPVRMIDQLFARGIANDNAAIFRH